MIQNYQDRDNRPDAVSSAHWNDLRVCSFDVPRFEATHHSLAFAIPTHSFPFKDTRNIPDLPFTL